MPDPDLLGKLGPSAAFPFSPNCLIFSNLCRALHDGRQSFQASLGELLFGSETDFNRVVNDASDSVRASLVSVGAGSWAEALLGAAAERPPPHSQLLLQRAAGRPVEVGLAPLWEVSSGGPAPMGEEIPESYEDARLIANHFSIGEDVAGYSDLQITAATGAHEALVGDSLRLGAALLAVSAWAASPEGDPRAVAGAFRDFAPEVHDFAARFADIDSAEYARQDLGEGLTELSLSVPLALARGAERYPRTVELVGLFDPLLIHARHPETGDLLFDMALREGSVKVKWYMRDGEFAYAASSAGPAVWNSDGEFTADVSIECSLVPLGLSMAAIPFPLMRWRCKLNRVGRTFIDCIEAGEPAFPTVAGAVFDVDQFRKLLVEGSHVQFEFLAASQSVPKPSVRFYTRILFPSKSVASSIAYWFRDFAVRQFCDLDVLLAVADLFEAMSKDSANVCQRARPP